MALVRPKTIVITTMSSKTPNVGSLTMASQESLLDSGGTRKRRRLTHLSPEEKMLRRKLKNRVAAQTARDRKKAKMTELEEIVANLEAENKRLQKENNSLKEQKDILSEENANLRQKLGHTTDGVVVKKEQESTESAALAPLQKDRIPALFQSMTHYVAFLLTLSLTCSWDYSSRSARRPTALPNRTHPLLPPKVLQTCQATQTTWTPWWGPHQQNWNPSMN